MYQYWSFVESNIVLKIFTGKYQTIFKLKKPEPKLEKFGTQTPTAFTKCKKYFDLFKIFDVPIPKTT